MSNTEESSKSSIILSDEDQNTISSLFESLRLSFGRDGPKDSIKAREIMESLVYKSKSPLKILELFKKIEEDVNPPPKVGRSSDGLLFYPAAFYLGCFLIWGVGRPESAHDKEMGNRLTKKAGGKALPWFIKMSEEGKDPCGYCEFAIGRILFKGDSVAVDTDKAVSFYQKAADKDHIDAIANLGWMYENGRGVQKSFSKALELYERSAKMGSPNAHFNCGSMYERASPEDGLEENMMLAIEHYNAAIYDKNSDAEANLALIYHEGISVDVDRDEAIELWESSHKKGNAVASYHLGTVYSDGDSVEANNEKSLYYFKIAAKNGDCDANFQLFFEYEEQENFWPEMARHHLQAFASETDEDTSRITARSFLQGLQEDGIIKHESHLDFIFNEEFKERSEYVDDDIY